LVAMLDSIQEVLVVMARNLLSLALRHIMAAVAAAVAVAGGMTAWMAVREVVEKAG